MIQLDLGDRRPLYMQIKEKFKELIVTGAIKEGERIPSVREMANMLAINPNTIQHAYKELEDEGFIISQRAKGSFIAPISKVQNSSNNSALYKSLMDTVAELIYRGENLDDIMATVNKIYENIRKE